MKYYNLCDGGRTLRIVIGTALLAFFLLASVGIVDAEIALPNVHQQMGFSDEIQMPGWLNATGTHFEFNNSNYRNIRLDSSESVKLTLESIPQMVIMNIESASGATATKITVGGFAPKTIYQKYEDDYHNLVSFITDSNGSYAYTQDLSNPHLVFIQPGTSKTSALAINTADILPSTIFIKDDATGGDCSLIGTWDHIKKTCTLAMDSTSNIQIDSNNIILDGNGSTITGNDNGFGVYLTGKTGVTIKNLKVNNFVGGIYLYNSDTNTIISNTVSNNFNGIYLGGMPFPSTNNNFIGNNASNNVYGIHLDMMNMQNNLAGNNASNNIYGIYFRLSGNNNLTGNTMADNKYNFYLYMNDNNHIIDTSNLVDGKPIYYVKNAIDQVYDTSTNAGTFFCINCNNVTLKGLALTKNGAGIFLWKTNNSRIENILAEDNVNGIILEESDNNILTGNNASNNGDRGIDLRSSNNNSIKYNNASNNIFAGINLEESGNNDLIGNAANSNDDGYGISLTFSGNNNLTGNHVSNNGHGISFYGSSTDNITLKNNIMSGNRWNFGIFLGDHYLDNNIDTSNLVDGKPIYYIKNAVDQVYDALTNAGTFFCLNCDNVTLKGLALTNNGAGVFLWKTNNSRIKNIQAMDNAYGFILEESGNNDLTGNTASSNFQGIMLKGSGNNDLTGNNVSNNEYYGIIVDNSNNNLIYNNYINNSNGLHNPINAVGTGNNTWNITKNNGTNIIGGSWLGGNYWSDYAGNDTDGDGLGDTNNPYNSSDKIVNGGDYLPLVSVSTINQPPVADFLYSPLNPIVNQMITFDAYPSYDPDGNIISCSWKISGNTFTSKIVNISFPAAGTYNANLIVTDNYGATNSTAKEINVTMPQATGGIIHGTKFNDVNRNRIRDPGEEGLANWKIRLRGIYTFTRTFVYRTAITDVNGNYIFTNIRPGFYIISEIPQPNWIPTILPLRPVRLTLNESIAVDFGNRRI